MAYWCYAFYVAPPSYFMTATPSVTQNLWSQKPNLHGATMINGLHINHGLSHGVWNILQLIRRAFDLCHPQTPPRMMILTKGTPDMQRLRITIYICSRCWMRQLWICLSNSHIHNWSPKRQWRKFLFSSITALTITYFTPSPSTISLTTTTTTCRPHTQHISKATMHYRHTLHFECKYWQSNILVGNVWLYPFSLSLFSLTNTTTTPCFRNISNSCPLRTPSPMTHPSSDGRHINPSINRSQQHQQLQ